jgi:hypothetical protein
VQLVFALRLTEVGVVRAPDAAEVELETAHGAGVGVGVDFRWLVVQV